MRITNFASVLTLSLAIGVAAVAAPPPDKGNGGGGDGGGEEPSVQLPTTVFIQTSRKGTPSLVVAGSDSSSTQTIYQFANNAAYLHDAVLVSNGHGRALVTDRSGNPLPLIVVDFWFDESGNVTAANDSFLVERLDWGCEALSSDGTRAIYSAANSGVVNSIDISTSTLNPDPIWEFDASQFFVDCDFQSEDALNGELHAVVVDTTTGLYRIDRINISGGSVASPVSPRTDEIRQLAVKYSNGSVERVAFDDPYGIRVGGSFSSADSNGVAVPNGRYPDFYCDGLSLLGRGLEKNRRNTLIYDIQNDSTVTYSNDYQSRAQTLC